MRLITAFGTGLLSGGLSCVATQGGLLAGLLARRKPVTATTGVAHGLAASTRIASARVPEPVTSGRGYTPPRGKQLTATPPRSSQAPGRARSGETAAMPVKSSLGEQFRQDGIGVGSFLVAKLMSHLLLGAGLGLLGSALRLDTKTRGVLQIVAAVILVLFALDLLGVAWARALVPRPPERLGRLVRRGSRSSAAFGPAVLGALTVLIPCGVTLGIEFLAIATGSPIEGALLLGAFVLGTMPVFAVVGLVAGRAAAGGNTRTARIRSLVGVVVLVTALLSLDTGLVLAGSRFSPRRSLANAINSSRDANTPSADAPATPVTVPADGIQRVRIEAHGSGYTPSRVTVKAGLPLKLTFFTTEYG